MSSLVSKDEMLIAGADFCRKKDLRPPRYEYHRQPDGNDSCLVHVGINPGVFGDPRETYVNRKDAAEDTAKKAMNALYREGVLAGVDGDPSNEAIDGELRSETQSQKKRKAPSGNLEDDKRRVAARLDVIEGEKKKIAAQLKSTANNAAQDCKRANSGVNEAPSVEVVRSQPTTSPVRPIEVTSRTRAGLTKALKYVSEPCARVDGRFDMDLRARSADASSYL
jgi:hypothetical protein